VLEGTTIVVFADDWGIHPSSAQHLFRRFLGRNRLIWINTVGLRLPRPTVWDLRKTLRKVGQWSGLTSMSVRSLHASGAKAPGGVEQPEIHDLPLVPLPLGRFARRLNASILKRAVPALIGSPNPHRPVFIVSTLPLTADLTGTVPGALFVYYIVDDYASWPGLSSELVRSMDDLQARRSDLVVAASLALAERHADRSRQPVQYLPHGVDTGHFASARQVRMQRRKRGERPTADALFFGAIDERIDLHLLAEVVAARPDLRFLLVGPAGKMGRSLARARNVRHCGPVAYEELPELLGRCEVAVLPYVRDRFGMTLSPLKAREALAAGLPVVASDVPELRMLGRGVCLGNSVGELAEGLDRALEGEIEVPGPEEFSNDSWEARAERLTGMLLGRDAA
jgi:glycosyltransferase involved in cell wall biosynthesis